MALTVEWRAAAAGGEWDTTVRAARQRHFLFEDAYLSYHADRFADASLLIRRDGQAVAALPASRHDDEIVSHGGLTFGGILLDPSLGAADALAGLELALAAWRNDGARKATIKPVPHIYHVAPAEEELFALHRLGARLVGRNIAQAVRADAPAIEWSSERRRAVRRGARAGLELGRSNAIEEYFTLLTDLLGRRYGARPVHTGEEMRMLADRFPDAIKLFAATADGELVAGVLIYETSMVAHAQYIGSSPRGQELRAQDALFAHLLAEVYTTKPWFDFGTSNQPSGEMNEGLVRNKEGYGARSIAYDRYVIDL